MDRQISQEIGKNTKKASEMLKRNFGSVYLLIFLYIIYIYILIFAL